MLGLRMARIGLRQPGLVPLGSFRWQPSRTFMSRAAKQVKDQVPSNMATRRFPKFMMKYAARIGGAPFSHLVSFLLIHELTAIIPLFGVWGAFYYLDYVPTGIPDWIVDKGSDFIRKLAKNNGWDSVVNAEAGAKIVLQGAAAYALVKAILPFRLIFSLWCTPWTAKHLVGPVINRMQSLFKKKPTGKGVKVGELPETLQQKKVTKKHPLQDKL